jgi:hypothetical protein
MVYAAVVFPHRQVGFPRWALSVLQANLARMSLSEMGARGPVASSPHERSDMRGGPQWGQFAKAPSPDGASLTLRSSGLRSARSS